MAEIGGITELQILEAEVALLKKQLMGVQQAEKTSSACARIVASIKAKEAKDSFIVKEGGTMEHNQYHTSAGASGDGGCCVVQ